MIESSKILIIKEYLNSEFPDCSIEDRYDPVRISQTFRISCENKTYLLTVSREFLDDHISSEISDLLERYELSAALEYVGDTRLLLSNQGLKREGENKNLDLVTKKMIRHLEDKWKGRSCPMCGAQQWGVTDSVYELKAYKKGTFMTEGTVMPVVPVVCNNCGNTILVNTIKVRTSKIGRKDQ